MFVREHHRRIAELLGCLDGRLLTRCEAWFAGGTAISLQLGEFRRSDDIDLLCASTDGYRTLRERVFERGLRGLARRELPVLREVRADQYGIRAVLGSAETPVKFEIVREARVPLRGTDELIEGVALLSREDLYVEKLLANTDRGLDRAALYRDLVDLCVMHERWGPIPAVAWERAREVYGAAVERAVQAVAQQLKNAATRSRCLTALEALPGVDAEVSRALRVGLRRPTRRA